MVYGSSQLSLLHLLEIFHFYIFETLQHVFAKLFTKILKLGKSCVCETVLARNFETLHLSRTWHIIENMILKLGYVFSKTTCVFENRYMSRTSYTRDSDFTGDYYPDSDEF